MLGECAHTRNFCARAVAVRATVINLIGGVGMVPGVPDRYFSHKIWSGFIEFKYQKGRISNAQYNICRELICNGDSVYLGRFDEQGNLTIEDPVKRAVNGTVLGWSERGEGHPGFPPQWLEVGPVGSGIVRPLDVFRLLRSLDAEGIY